ncbi:MAG: ABC transporter ATP-binding protein, partial [Treponema sp.]|nr:ABC transporter ATP-binding protein [Treponema sp.]
VGLLGPNGSGKTTLLKLAAGLLTPTSGSIELCGMTSSELTKEIVAYQPDKIYLNNWMTVENLVSMMADFYQTFNREKAMDMLSKLKLNPKDKLKSMSKGNKEKVQLILTMSRDVPLYILDEPIGGVDPAARDYILNTIINNYQENATVIISTHLISDIENVLNYIIFLKEGKVVRSGDVDDIREKEGKSIDILFREEFKC